MILSATNGNAGGTKPTSIGPEVVIEAVLRQVHAFLTLLPNLIMGVIFLLFVWGLAVLVRRGVTSAGHRSHMSDPLVRALGRLSSIIMWVLGLFTAATIVVPSFNPGSMIAGLGISSIAIGFAFKDIFQNFLAGLLLLWTQPFRVGDQIKFGEYEGFVDDIDIRATLIRTYDGELAILPNSAVYTSAILVKTAYDVKRGKLEVFVNQNVSAEEARERIETAVRETQGVLQNPTPTVVVSDLKGASMHFTVFLWSDDPGAAQNRALVNLKRQFDAAQVDVVAGMLFQK
ncbi:MAG TPA: mechanosensitive ion channel domain-containing protein [Bryobacteraceae bacterium]|nr:mechanosensitive ion channel domain-containing protein [Bryobacteraceae bacterium]